MLSLPITVRKLMVLVHSLIHVEASTFFGINFWPAQVGILGFGLEVKGGFLTVSIYSGGQKCWDLSSDITKTSDPSSPTPNKVEFCAKWVEMSVFLGTTSLGGVGGEQKIVVRSGVLRNKYLEGLFRAVLGSFVLHCLKFIQSDKLFCLLSQQKYRKTFSLEGLKSSFLSKMPSICCR